MGNKDNQEPVKSCLPTSKDISDLGDRITSNEGDILNLQGSVSTNVSDISNLNTRVGTAEGGISDLKTDVLSLEGDVQGVQADLSNKEDKLPPTPQDPEDMFLDGNRVWSPLPPPPPVPYPGVVTIGRPPGGVAMVLTLKDAVGLQVGTLDVTPTVYDNRILTLDNPTGVFEGCYTSGVTGVYNDATGYTGSIVLTDGTSISPRVLLKDGVGSTNNPVVFYNTTPYELTIYSGGVIISTYDTSGILKLGPEGIVTPGGTFKYPTGTSTTDPENTYVSPLATLGDITNTILTPMSYTTASTAATNQIPGSVLHDIPFYALHPGTSVTVGAQPATAVSHIVSAINTLSLPPAPYWAYLITYNTEDALTYWSSCELAGAIGYPTSPLLSGSTYALRYTAAKVTAKLVYDSHTHTAGNYRRIRVVIFKQDGVIGYVRNTPGIICTSLMKRSTVTRPSSIPQCVVSSFWVRSIPENIAPYIL